jgi:protein TonB
VVALAPGVPPPSLAPIEVVRVEPPAPPPRPPEPPKPKAKLTAPRLVTQPTELAQPTQALPSLLNDAPRREPTPAVADASDSGRRFMAGTTTSSWSIPGPPGGDARGKGTLFSTGDLPIAGTAGGSGSGGAGGDGTRLDGAQVAVKGNPTGLTSFARPAGGYQTQPRYPDSARRQGIEGETLLRFQVLATGRVSGVSVARSAGHADLDRAAIDAVKTWLFEPARRGREAVAVWVTLPVRFRLRDGLAE